VTSSLLFPVSMDRESSRSCQEYHKLKSEIDFQEISMLQIGRYSSTVGPSFELTHGTFRVKGDYC